MAKYENFKRNLNHIMSEKNIRQVDIANAIGVAQTCVSRWCCGQTLPLGNRLVRLSQFLSVSPSTLFENKITLSTSNEEKLLSYFRSLNSVGKEKALERMYELSQLYWYDKENVL